MSKKLSMNDLRNASYGGQSPSSEDVRQRLFNLTGVWTDHARGSKPNYHSVANATRIVQGVGANFSHLGGSSRTNSR